MVLLDLGNNWWLGTTYNWCTQTLIAIIVLLYILRRSTKLKYYFSYGFYISLTLILSMFYIPLFMLRPWNPANIRLIKPPASIISKIIGIKWELRGEETLSVDRAGVLIGNHQSLIDALGIAEITPYLKKCITISRKEIFYYWPFGLSAWLAGVVFIDRYNGRAANKILLDTCSVLLNSKAKLLIFPEGTRNRVGDKLLPFKKGAFRVAIAAQIPLLPIVFSPYYFIDSQRKRFDGGRMIIKALDPIPTEGLTTDDIDALMEKSWNIMMDHYQILKKEIHHEIKTKIVDQL